MLFLAQQKEVSAADTLYLCLHLSTHTRLSHLSNMLNPFKPNGSSPCYEFEQPISDSRNNNNNNAPYENLVLLAFWLLRQICFKCWWQVPYERPWHNPGPQQSRPSASFVWIVWLNFIDLSVHKTKRLQYHILKQTKSSSIINQIYCTFCMSFCLFVSFVHNSCFVQFYFTLFYVYVFVNILSDSVKE